MRKTIQTDAAPAAVGPYSQAIVSDGLAWVSGQIPLDPRTGALVDGDIGDQTRQVLLNLEAVLDACGSGLDRVLRATIFLTDMQDFQVVNGVYAEFFSAEPPARACVAVAALPKGARVEIDAVARV